MRDWAHSPAHRFGEGGAYMVTAATYLKQHHFRTHERLDKLTQEILDRCAEAEVRLQAWAVFSNHYHIVALTEDGERLRAAITRIHSVTGYSVNKEDGVKGRKVWFQFRDTLLTNSASYLSRLRYVHGNAVRHRLVKISREYPWCSAGWFLRNAPANMQRTLASVKSDRVKVTDDFEPCLPEDWRVETSGCRKE